MGRLVITRDTGTSFKIGNDITVEILSVNRSQVKVGITAPKEIQIRRDNMVKDHRQP